MFKMFYQCANGFSKTSTTLNSCTNTERYVLKAHFLPFQIVNTTMPLCFPVPGYGRFTNRHRDRGTMIAGSQTALECAGACNGDPRCAAFDFNPNLRQCWHQTTTQECRNVNIVFNNNCCERYIKSSYTCPTPFVPPNFNGKF